MELPFHMPARKDIWFNLAIEVILNLTLEVLSITVKFAGPGSALPWTPQDSLIVGLVLPTEFTEDQNMNTQQGAKLQFCFPAHP